MNMQLDRSEIVAPEQKPVTGNIFDSEEEIGESAEIIEKRAAADRQKFFIQEEAMKAVGCLSPDFDPSDLASNNHNLSPQEQAKQEELMSDWVLATNKDGDSNAAILEKVCRPAMLQFPDGILPPEEVGKVIDRVVTEIKSKGHVPPHH